MVKEAHLENFNIIDRREFFKRYRKWLAKHNDTIQELQKIPEENKLSWGLLMEQNAEKYADELALKFEDMTQTYKEFNESINQYAHYFQKIGIKKGDTIQVIVKNSPEFLYIFTAAGKIGAIVSLINTDIRGKTLVHSLNITPGNYTIIDEGCCNNYLQIQPQVNLSSNHLNMFLADKNEIPVPQKYDNLLEQVKNMPKSNPSTTSTIKTNDPLAFIFTSGTTGLSKASVLIHYRMIGGAYYHGRSVLETTPQDTVYVPLPFFHTNATTSGWAPAVGGGACLAMARKFSVSQFWNDIRKHDATIFTYVGEVLRYLYNQPPSPDDRNHKVRAILGNGLRPEIWKQFKERFGIEKIYEFYGASETSTIFINIMNFDNTCGFCGESYAVAKYNIEKDEPVKDENNFYIKVQPGDVGLLLFEKKAERTFVGYTNKDATNRKLLRDVFKDGDVWFNTGDLVRDQGNFHIQFIDRLGDTFRWKGNNVSTTEIEEVINKFKEVRLSCVYGVKVPHTDGRAGMATIVPEISLEEFNLKKFTDYLKENLTSYAIPLFLRFKTDIETTSTYKFKKSTLKEDGFEPKNSEDQIYILIPGNAKFELITTKIKEKLHENEYRF